MPTNDLVNNYSRPAIGNKPGGVEAWGLTQAARRLNEAKSSGDATAMKAAIRLNWRLWTIFQAELLDPQCTVPLEIRENVLSLANFIDKHTVAFMAEPKPEMLDVLIGINRELAGGLFAAPAKAEAEATAEMEPLSAGPPPASAAEPSRTPVKISI